MMNTLKKIQKKGFSFAIQHINNTLENNGLTAIILAAICCNTANEQEVFLQKLSTFEEKRNSIIDVNNLSLSLQYAIIYYGIFKRFPKGMEETITDYYNLVSSEKTDTNLLSSYLFLSQATKNSVALRDSISFNFDIDLETFEQNTIPSLLNEIENRTYYGIIPVINTSPKLIAILESSLIEACSAYNFQKISKILRALSYLNASKSLSIHTALTFIKHNQHPKGFIGFYEKEFASIPKDKKIDKTAIRLSSTLTTITALLEYHTKFRLHNSLGKNIHHEMESLHTSFI